MKLKRNNTEEMFSCTEKQKGNVLFNHTLIYRKNIWMPCLFAFILGLVNPENLIAQQTWTGRQSGQFRRNTLSSSAKSGTGTTTNPNAELILECDDALKTFYECLRYSYLIALGGIHRMYAINQCPENENIIEHKMIFSEKKVDFLISKLGISNSSNNLYESFKKFRSLAVALKMKKNSCDKYHDACVEDYCKIKRRKKDEQYWYRDPIKKTTKRKKKDVQEKKNERYLYDVLSLRFAVQAVCRDINYICRALKLKEYPIIDQ